MGNIYNNFKIRQQVEKGFQRNDYIPTNGTLFNGKGALIKYVEDLLAMENKSKNLTKMKEHFRTSYNIFIYGLYME